MKRMIDNKEFNALKNEVSEIETDVSGLIDDTATSSSKVWSSNKVNTELGQLKGMGVVYSTSATPTNEDNTFIFNKTDFITEPIPSWTSIIGKQICQIVDSKIKYIYSVVSSSESTISCVLIGEVGGGNQFYEHNIWLIGNNSDININIIIENTSNEAIDSLTKIKTALHDLGYWNDNNYRPAYTKVNGWKGTSVVTGLANLDSGKLFVIFSSSNNEAEITSTTVVQDTINTK